MKFLLKFLSRWFNPARPIAPGMYGQLVLRRNNIGDMKRRQHKDD